MKKTITIFLLAVIPLLSFTQENSAGKSYYVDYQLWNASEEKPNIHINCGNNDILNTGEEITIEAWIRPNRAVEDQKIIGKAMLIDGGTTPDNGYVYGLNVASVYSEIWNPARNSVEITGPGTLAIDSAWMHITTTFKAGEKLINYVNGVLYSEVEVELTNPIGTNDGDLIIGLAPWDALSLMYFGQIDEIKIWNKALSDVEIKANMHIPLNGDEENLVAYYDFNDILNDTVITDLSGNENTGKVRVHNNEFWSWADSYAPIGSDEMKNMSDIDASWSFKNPDQWQSFASGAAQGSTNIEEKEYEKYLVIGHDLETGVSTDFNPENTLDLEYKHANREFILNVGGNVLATNLYIDLNSMGMEASEMAIDSESSLYTLLWRESESDNYTAKYHPTGVNLGFLIFENIPLTDGFYTIGYGEVELNDIQQESFEKNIQVYPNPANDIVTITNTKDKNIQIFDISGRLINSFVSESYAERFDVSGYHNGVYFVKISQDNLSITRKIIINK